MYSLIYTTTADEDEAKKMAKVLVEERLVACANIFPIKSVYRWSGKVQDGGETAILLKTREGLAEKTTKRIKELHSYEIPCIISVPIKNGYKKYLEWINEETSKRKK